MRFFACIVFLSTLTLTAQEVNLTAEDGTVISAELGEEGVDSHFIKRLNLFLEEEGLNIEEATLMPQNPDKEKDGKRDFYAEVSPSKQQDIDYLILSMANKYWPELLMSKRSMDLAGERIEDVHPLRFLLYIFSKEDLKVGMRNIRKNKKVWSRFSHDLFHNLDLEADRDNILYEHGLHFAKEVQINPKLILDPIEARDWSTLIDNMIYRIPRKGEWDRYRMKVVTQD